MNIIKGFKSIGRSELALLALGAVLCAGVMSLMGGWTAQHAISTSVGGFILAIPMMAIQRAFKRD